MASVMDVAMAAARVVIAARVQSVARVPSADRVGTVALDQSAAPGPIVDQGQNVGRDLKIGVSRGSNVRIGRAVIGLRASARSPGKVGAVLRSRRRSDARIGRRMRVRSAIAAWKIPDLTGPWVIGRLKMAQAARVWDLTVGVRRVRAGRVASVDVAVAAEDVAAALAVGVVGVRVVAEIRVAAVQTPACHLNRAADRVDTSGARGGCVSGRVDLGTFRWFEKHFVFSA
jgi:hypothetical protein